QKRQSLKRTETLDIIEHNGLSVKVPLPNAAQTRPVRHHSNNNNNDNDNGNNKTTIELANYTQIMTPPPPPPPTNNHFAKDSKKLTDERGSPTNVPPPLKDDMFPTQKKKVWFAEQKEEWSRAVKECALRYEVDLPADVVERIVLDSIVMPGCYFFSGVVYPPQRTEADLFVDYCQMDSDYEKVSVQQKTGSMPFPQRKKPKTQPRKPERNTSMLWLDEDGSVCGFRCVWLQSSSSPSSPSSPSSSSSSRSHMQWQQGNNDSIDEHNNNDQDDDMIEDQKYAVSTGCWTLTGELSVTFEQYVAEDVFTGRLELDRFCGEWSAGNEVSGTFQYSLTKLLSYYMRHSLRPCLAQSRLVGKSTYVQLDDHLSLAFSFHADNNMFAVFLLRYLQPTSHHHHHHHHHHDALQIGTGVWTDDGIITTGNVTCVPLHIVFEFHGCTDGKRVIGTN
ncbi:hypothetical protein RFI_23680, partial [Reticulomyxa filosa]